MQLPVDIPAVLKAATDIDAARTTPLAVRVYIEPDASPDLAAHVRSLFASGSPSARVSIEYLAEREMLPADSSEDMAVLVAATDADAGFHAQQLRSASVPTMVVTDSPETLRTACEAAGYAIPVGDVAAPDTPAPNHQDVLSPALEAHASEEPLPLTDDALLTLDERMGRWIITACAGKKLAFALAFPFIRKPLSLDSVTTTSLQNAGIGAVMFIPGADMPIMTLNQMKMLLQIAAAYGQPLNADRIKELALVVGGAFLCRGVARQIAGVVPILGWAVKGAIGFAGTEAMGRAAIEYFEAGGDIVGMANVIQTARDKAVLAAGKVASSPLTAKASEAFGAVASKVSGAVNKNA